MRTIDDLITSILQNIFFYVQHKKETQVWMTWVNDDNLFAWANTLNLKLKKNFSLNKIKLKYNY